MDKKVTKQSVEHRIQEWVKRLDELYSNVEQWLPKDSFQIEHGTVPQITEELMERFKVKARPVPVLTASDSNSKIRLVPSAIWILGADGRVNLTVNDRQYILVDLREQDHGPSKWRVVTTDIRRNTIPFTRKSFQELLRE